MKYKILINKCYGGFGLTDNACESLKAAGLIKDKIDVYEPEFRHNQEAIQFLENLGMENVEKEFAQLEVVEIEGNKYRIHEYDGAEIVITPDQEKYVEIK